MSPLPTSLSAPLRSMITRLSSALETWKAMRQGMLALIKPVTTSARGDWVATIRWMPAARAFCAMRQMASSMSAGAVCMRSASSSMMTTM